MRVGIEIGGTFTDLIAISADGVVSTSKVLSTPKNPAIGALDVLKAWGGSISGIEILIHGSTVATNAILERKGAPTILIVTEGYRDILEIQRHEKDEIFNMLVEKPKPLVPRECVIEVNERLDYTGAVLEPIRFDAGWIRHLDALLRQKESRSVAICLLHSYANGAHEAALQEFLESRYSDLTISLSSEINPEYREYERASTTTMSAYLRPVVDRYMHSFEELLREEKFAGPIHIMQSSGGIIPVAAARAQAVRTLVSGPAAGVVGAVEFGRRSGYSDLITLDMGGTSTDVCLVKNGNPLLSFESRVDRLPVRVPMYDIQIVGAGGGSIAWLDRAGLLRVGPQSAGAAPGPCCYGMGGADPTVTDANTVLGLLRPHNFLGGRLDLKKDLAAKAIGMLGERLGLTLYETAEGIRRIATHNMVETIRLVSIEKGHDPRDFALLAFGGAGGLHVCELAESMAIETVLIPENQGVLSAVGLLVSPFGLDYVQSIPSSVTGNPTDHINRALHARQQQAGAELESYGLSPSAAEYRSSLDIRYLGQASELNIPLLDAVLGPDGLERAIADFHQAYRTRFGHAFPEKRTQIVTARLAARIPPIPIMMPLKPSKDAPPIEEGEIFFGGKWQQAKYLWRPKFGRNFALEGPAVVEDKYATTFVTSGWRLTVDEIGTLILKRV